MDTASSRAGLQSRRRSMIVLNKSAHRPYRRRFSVEPLEDRFLLSGVASALLPDTDAASAALEPQAADRGPLGSSNDDVQVLEIKTADGAGDTTRAIGF